MGNEPPPQSTSEVIDRYAAREETQDVSPYEGYGDYNEPTQHYYPQGGNRGYYGGGDYADEGW